MSTVLAPSAHPFERISETWPAPTITPHGRAVLVDPETGRYRTWKRSGVTRLPYGTFRIEVGAVWDCRCTVEGHPVPYKVVDGVDVTVFRDARTRILRARTALPFGEDVAELRFPRITGFDNIDEDEEFAWLRGMPNVDIWHVLPDGETEVGYWHGFLAEPSDATNDGLSVHLLGAMQEAGLRDHMPPMLVEDRDCGSLLNMSLMPQEYSRPLTPYQGFWFGANTTDINTLARGSRSQSVLDFCTEVLSYLQLGEPSNSWTVAPVYDAEGVLVPRAYHLCHWDEAAPGLSTDRSFDDLLDDFDTFDDVLAAFDTFDDLLEGDVVPQSSTVHFGANGVTWTGGTDRTASANAIGGEGITPKDGSRWRNGQYPNLNPITPPSYPGEIEYGDTDTDWPPNIVSLVQSQMRLDGMPDVRITGEYDIDTRTAVYKEQQLAGLPFADSIDEDTWDAIWDRATGDTDVSASWIRDLAIDPEIPAYLYYNNGSYRADNPDWDGHPETGTQRKKMVQRTISHGNVSKARATLYSERLLTRDTALLTGHTGTCRLDGVSPVERHGYDVRPGGLLTVKYLHGGNPQITVIGIDAQIEAGIVEYSGMSQPCSLMELTARVEMQRAMRHDSASSFFNQFLRTNRPMLDQIGHDTESGAGVIVSTPLDAGWNVIPFIGWQRGSISALNAFVEDDPQQFVVAIFGNDEITASDLESLVPDPLVMVEEGGVDYAPFRVPSRQKTLRKTWGWCETFGEPGNPAGYFPARFDDVLAYPVTGELLAESSFEIAAFRAPWMKAAVWVESSGSTYRQEALVNISDGG